MDDLAERIAALSPEQRSLLALSLNNLTGSAPSANGSDGSSSADKRIVSYIVPKPEQTMTVEELRGFLKQRLPDYMLPSAFEFLDALPQTATGKVDKGALPEPQGLRPQLNTSFVMPRTTAEQAIAAIWCSVLQVDRVGVDDNFFDLGGHSLLIIQVRAKLREAFKEVSVIDLFKYPTINSLAQFLTRRHDEQRDVEQSGVEPASSTAQVVAPEPEIAIVGMAGRFPQARNVEEFWRNLRDGVESISIFSPQELLEAGVERGLLQNPNFIGARAALDEIERFDAAFFGFNPREAETLDPQQRVYLECAWEALENAGFDSETDGRPVGVYAGASPNTYLAHNILANPEAARYAGSAQTRIANDANHLPTLASYKLNLKGPSLNVQTACSTSLVAVHLACQSLLNGECDVALAGGVSIGIPQKSGYLYEPDGIYSPDGHCRAFDARAAGTVGGSGVGVVVLKRLADAVADGDTIRAVIKGSAVNNDGGHKVGYTAPSVDGEAKVITAAHAKAKVEPASISYIETHGTGTHLGDPIEITALTQAFGDGESAPQHCAIGSVKTNIGHLDAAAGIAGLIKTVLALEHKQLPPSLHFTEPNPKIDFASSPFYVNTKLTEWQTTGLRRAGVSSFGIGGTNTHLVLEEAPPFEAHESYRPTKLLLLSAKTASALEAATANLLEHLERHPEQDLADIAYTLQVGRRVFAHRRAIVCTGDASQVRAALEKRDPKRLFDTFQEAKQRPLVFMFPGQGAQYVNMGLELYQTEPTFRAEVDRCAELLKPDLGLDLRELLYPQEAQEAATQELKKTSIAQPALFTIEYALAKLWLEWGVRPQAMIGHSIGEYVAACLAGLFSLEDALSLIALRGRLMQELPGGSMLAVPLSLEQVGTLLDDEVSLASVNSATQCVISGPADAIEGLQRKLARMKIESQLLHTSHAFHSRMMEPMLEQFAEAVSKTERKPPTIPYLSNVTGTWIEPLEATDPEYWSKHLRQTVRFGDGVNELTKEPERLFLEVGPGHSLSTLVRRHKSASEQVLDVFSTLRHVHEQRSDTEALMSTLGSLWSAGARIDWTGFYTHERRRRVSLPTYPFERRPYWIEPLKRTHADRLHQVPALVKRPLRDWFYIPSWKRMAWPIAAQQDEAQRDATWLIFLDEHGLGAKMAGQLRADNHITAITVTKGAEFKRLGEDAYALNPGRADEYKKLFEELQLRGLVPEKILYFSDSDSDEDSTADSVSLEHSKETCFYSLLFLAQALIARRIESPVRIEVVSHSSQQVLGDESLRPQQTLALGICKVLPQEQPNLACRHVDVILPPDDAQERELVKRLIAEFKSDLSDSEVAYRGNQRWVKAFEPLRLDKAHAEYDLLRREGVYLLIGGLGAIGYVLAEHLARAVRAKLVLVGRTPLPERSAWENWLSTHDEDDRASVSIRKIKALEELGATVVFHSANVANRALMQHLINQIYEQFGALHGVVYAAVNTDEQRFMPLLEDTSRDDCERHFQAKVDGLLVLEEVLRNRALDFCLLCSSLSSVLGGLGFTAYAAANIFLDSFAQRQHSAGQARWLSVNWDAWHFDEKQETRDFGSTELGSLAITQEEGVSVFERILSAEGEAQVIISTGDLQARIERHSVATPAETQAVKQAELISFHPRPDLQSAYVAPRNDSEQVIADIWQELLGIERVGVDDNFFNLGGHSLLATRVNSRLREAFQVSLPLQRFFQSPTLAELTEAVLEQLIKEQGEQEIEQLLEEVERLSPDD